MNLDIQPLAEQDILSTYDYFLEHASHEIAIRFMDSVASAMQDAMRRPAIGTPTPFTAPDVRAIRSWPVPGFPSIRIYYISR
ncbi:MAG: hypothetical protein JSS87_06795 [Acidobacteria bacterium]|nr:hypothetical protein [Acidobacteriota bacterium]